MTISKQWIKKYQITFDNLQATMISSTMYYKADAIHLVDVKTKISIRQGVNPPRT